MRSNWLYLAMRSVRDAEPVLIWPVRKGDGQVGDGGVFGLAAAVAGHRGVAVAVGQLNRVDRFGQRTDLVHLDQDAVGDAFVDAALQDLGVGDEQVVADSCTLVAQFLGQQFPAVPVAFVAGRLRSSRWGSCRPNRRGKSTIAAESICLPSTV
jgi:hypothetical protein